MNSHRHNKSECRHAEKAYNTKRRQNSTARHIDDTESETGRRQKEKAMRKVMYMSAV